MATVKIGNDSDMPLLGLGTAQLKADEAFDAVSAAIDAGIRHFDTAFAFQNEDAVGLAIKNKIKDGAITREDVFVSTKLHVQFHGKEGVKEGIERSLKNLNLDFVDLFLVHFPVPMERHEDRLFPSQAGKPLTTEVDHLDTWASMETALANGQTKAVGLANFSRTQVERICAEGNVKPAVLQIEVHPHFPQVDLIKFCHDNGIVVSSFLPFGPEPAARRVNKDAEPLKGPLEDNTVKTIAEAHGKSPAQVCLKYLMQQSIAAIPRTTAKDAIEEYSIVQVDDFKLSDSELKSLQNTGINRRGFDAPFMKKHKEYPFAE